MYNMCPQVEFGSPSMQSDEDEQLDDEECSSQSDASSSKRKRRGSKSRSSNVEDDDNEMEIDEESERRESKQANLIAIAADFPKRALNAFMIFCQHKRNEMAQRGVVYSMIDSQSTWSAEWKAMPAEEKIVRYQVVPTMFLTYQLV